MMKGAIAAALTLLAAGMAQAHEVGLKWEYKVISGNTGIYINIDEQILNKYGAQGWEMYDMIEVGSGYAFYLRRPYRGEKPPQDDESAKEE